MGSALRTTTSSRRGKPRCPSEQNPHERITITIINSSITIISITTTVLLLLLLLLVLLLLVLLLWLLSLVIVCVAWGVIRVCRRASDQAAEQAGEQASRRAGKQASRQAGKQPAHPYPMVDLLSTMLGTQLWFEHHVNMMPGTVVLLMFAEMSILWRKVQHTHRGRIGSKSIRYLEYGNLPRKSSSPPHSKVGLSPCSCALISGSAYMGWNPRISAWELGYMTMLWCYIVSTSGPTSIYTYTMCTVLYMYMHIYIYIYIYIMYTHTMYERGGWPVVPPLAPAGLSAEDSGGWPHRGHIHVCIYIYIYIVTWHIDKTIIVVWGIYAQNTQRTTHRSNGQTYEKGAGDGREDDPCFSTRFDFDPPAEVPRGRCTPPCPEQEWGPACRVGHTYTYVCIYIYI